MVEHANRLAYEIRDAVKESPLSPQKRLSFQRQAGEVPDNLVKALWKLARLRRIAGSIDQRYEQEKGVVDHAKSVYAYHFVAPVCRFSLFIFK